MAMVWMTTPSCMNLLMIGSLGRARLLAHDVRVAFFGAQRQRRGAVGDQVQPQQLDGRQRGAHAHGNARKASAEHGGDEDDQDLGHVAGDEVVHELADVA